MVDFLIANINAKLDMQSREKLDLAVVAEYKEAMESGSLFPPVLIYVDETGQAWLADGFHRLHAAKQLGRHYINAEVRQGSQIEAQWYSFGANKEHGLRRSQADKEKAVKAALLHPNGATMSDGAIAQHVGVSAPTVAKYRRELIADSKISESAQRVGADGRTINTTKIGSNKDTLYLATPNEDPEVEEARQIALLAVGSSQYHADTNVRQSSGSSSWLPDGKAYRINFGGGFVILNFSKPNESREKFGRDQVAITIERAGVDHLYRFPIKQLVKWKLALAASKSTPVQTDFEPQQMLIVWTKCARYDLGNDGIYVEHSYLKTDENIRGRFSHAFQQGNSVFVALTVGVGYNMVVPLGAVKPYIKEEPAPSPAQPEPGLLDWVITRTGHLGQIVADSGGAHVKVETINATTTHKRGSLTLTEAPSQHEEQIEQQLAEQVEREAPTPQPESELFMPGDRVITRRGRFATVTHDDGGLLVYIKYEGETKPYDILRELLIKAPQYDETTRGAAVRMNELLIALRDELRALAQTEPDLTSALAINYLNLRQQIFDVLEVDMKLDMSDVLGVVMEKAS